MLSMAIARAAGEEWVSAAPDLPEGHNGGVRERLVAPASRTKPHVLMVIVDDFGFAEVGWHRNVTIGGVRVAGTNEVRTPHLDALVRGGLELSHHYVYKCCSPTRSAVQSGRNPYHVTSLNAAMEIHNEDADPIGGFAGIPRNMTGLATKMAAAGYSTYFAGKWDAGMATEDHSPVGRGYQEGMWYWHHQNDYWSMEYPLGCPNTKHAPVTAPVTAGPGPGPGPGPLGSLEEVAKPTKKTHPLTDLWHLTSANSPGVPARGFNNTCYAPEPAGGEPAQCSAGPRNRGGWWGGYEDALLEQVS